MGLSNDLISQFAKVVNSDKKTKSETTVYGTVVDYGGKNYVRFDGSDLLTPVESMVDAIPGERVSVLLKDHTATVTGNISSPSARSATVQKLEGDLQAATALINDLKVNKLSAHDADLKYATIERLVAVEGTIQELDVGNLEATYAKITDLNATNAEVNNLKATIADFDYVTADELEATDAKINNLSSTYATFSQATANRLDAVEADIENLDVGNLEATYANIDFSNIGTAAMQYFYAQSGLIKDVVVGDQTITGELVGVTIRGDRIIGGSIVADKLVIKGNDGIYYKLNAEGGATPDQLATEEFKNGLHGSNIIANSITAEKIDVKDLVAFDATIGNFNIGSNSIYSGAKSSVGNTTRGIYMDTDGQMNLGDSNNYLKFYKDQNGTYKLAIAAESLTFGASSTSVEDAINDVQDSVKNISVGGRNLLIGTKTPQIYTSGTLNLYTFANLQSAEALDGKEVTVSFDYEANVTSGRAIFNFYYSWFRICDFGTSTGQINGSGHFTRTLVLPDVTHETTSAIYIAAASEGFSGSVKISNMKLELGNIATDWTPAPEDVDANISNAQSTANNAVNAVNNIQVGGRNLFGFNKGVSFNNNMGSNVTLTKTPDKYGFNIKLNANITKHQNILRLQNLGFNIVDHYTFSANVYASTDNVTIKMDICDAGETAGKNPSFTIGTTKKKISFTAYATAHVASTYYGFVDISSSSMTAGTVIYFEDVKIERGNKVTDWTPAPEDVATDISAAQTSANNAQTAANNAQSTANNANNKIDNLKVSGRNLLQQSIRALAQGAWNTVTNSTPNGNAIRVCSLAPISLTTSASYVVSNASPDYQVTLLYFKSDGTYITETSWITTYPYKFTTPTNAAYMRVSFRKTDNTNLYPQSASSSLKFKIEKGTIPTEWTRAPEDEPVKIDYSQGKMLHKDPMFSAGNNSCGPYNNAGNSNVTISRIARSSDNPFTASGYQLQIQNIGAASPNCGGYYQTFNSRANGVFVYRIVAKIPRGRNIQYASNSVGNGGLNRWLTPQYGTGKFEEYIIEITCGSSGSFLTGGYFNIDGAVGTSSAPVTWYVAYSAGFDMSNISDVSTAQNTANNAQNTANTANSTANTALTNTKKQADKSNYCQLNTDTASLYGFTFDSTADGRWYTKNAGSITRDMVLSDTYQCKGAERFRITYEISTSVQGVITNGGSDIGYVNCQIGFACRDAAGTYVSWPMASAVKATAAATATKVSSIVQLHSSARQFHVFLQAAGWSNFSGTLKIRNVRVEKIDDEAAKTATNYMNFDNGLIIGDMTASKLGNNVFIDSDSVDIRNGSTIYASYAANKIALGLNSTSSKITLCGDKGTIYVAEKDRYGGGKADSLYIDSEDVTIYGDYSISSLLHCPIISGYTTIAQAWLHLTSQQQTADDGTKYYLPNVRLGMMSTMSKSGDSAYGTHTNFIEISPDLGTKLYSGTSMIGCKGSSAEMFSFGTVKLSVAETGINPYIEITRDDSSYGKIYMTANTIEINPISSAKIDSALTVTGSLTAKSTASISGNTTIGGTLGVTSALTANSSATIKGILYANGNIVLPNHGILYGVNASGVNRGLVYIQGDNLIRFGYGGYDNAEGRTDLLGNQIRFFVKHANDTNYKPYWEGGDTVSFEWYGAGFISSSASSVYFSIPLSKPMVGGCTVSVSSVNGLVIRQNNAYVYGSGASTYAKPSSYTAVIDSHGGFIRVKATMSNTTNAINNAPCGIAASIKLTFAYS